MWTRQAKDAQGNRAGQRWIEGYERVAETAANLPGTRLVYVSDREADMISLMVRAQELGTPADWLIRSTHDRARCPKEPSCGARQVKARCSVRLPSRWAHATA